jgi:hypothetical protein
VQRNLTAPQRCCYVQKRHAAIYHMPVGAVAREHGSNLAAQVPMATERGPMPIRSPGPRT